MRSPGTRRAATAALTTAALLLPAVALAPVATAAVVPATCAEVRAADPAAPDGEYVIVNSGVTITVLCADMDWAPVEYLVLPQGEGSNYGSFGNSSGIQHRHFAAARLVLPPETGNGFALETYDTRFTTSVGVSFNNVALATTASCSAGALTANLDLRGTPFAADTTLWYGTYAASEADQVVDVVNNNQCQWFGPGHGRTALTVLAAAPTLPVQPASTSVVVGGTATFTADFEGYPQPTVVWRTRPDVDSEWGVVDGATEETLTLADVPLDLDGHLFQAVATNEHGVLTSADVTLAVTTEAPAFTSGPVDPAPASGQDATFSVEVTGAPTPTLQWQIRTDADGEWADVDGATGPSLTLPAVTSADRGTQVQVVATNVVDTVTSTTATLSVLGSVPVFTTGPVSTAAPWNADATFTAAVSGDPAPTLQWQVHDSAGDTWSDLEGETGATLTLTDVVPADSGTVVRAVATNDAGSTPSAAATLTVTGTVPSFVVSPVSTTVTPGQTAAFSVEVAGDPVPTIQWQTSVDGQEWADVADATSAQLSFEDVGPGMDGLQVRAVLTNEVDSVTSASAFLWVGDTAFDDVPWGAPFYTEIQWLNERGLAEGTEVGDRVEFRPEAAMSRQAMAAFLYRLAGAEWAPEEGVQTFADVDADHRFYVEIEWMAQAGLTTGYEGGQFQPATTVSRQAMAAFLHRLFLGQRATLGEAEWTGFSDVGEDHPFSEAITWLVQNEIVDGYEDGTYRGTAPVTRQAMAAVLYRYENPLR